jgi:hypothetical protein
VNGAFGKTATVAVLEHGIAVAKVDYRTWVAP